MNFQRIDEARAYVEALEAERRKMLMFKNELPLSIDLVTEAIESCKGRLECGVEQRNVCASSEETTSVDVGVPVLEFIPIKKCVNGALEESEEIRPGDDMDDDVSGKKSNWLSSAQLWNRSPDDLPSKSEALAHKEFEGLVDKCKSLDKEELEEKSNSPKQAESSSAESQKNGGGCKKEDKEGCSKSKQRRCWSQDLHRSFLHSLNELGGAHVATPKLIRELMKVDGLTNDEVKSHLQKYRLHTRGPTPPPSQRKTLAPPQFVVVGSIWPPQSDYSTLTSTPTNNGALGTARARVYTPMAAPPASQLHQGKEPLNQNTQIKFKDPDGHGDGQARCISQSMSSSTRTTASQVY